MYAISENHINKVKSNNLEVFSENMNPSLVKVDCPDGLSVDQECDENLLFTDKDSKIIEQREVIIGLWDDINTICFYLSVILALTLTYSLWSSSKNKKIKRGYDDVLH
ncbi:hypothetical protein D1872_262500 [compost metagenome]